MRIRQPASPDLFNLNQPLHVDEGTADSLIEDVAGSMHQPNLTTSIVDEVAQEHFLDLSDKGTLLAAAGALIAEVDEGILLAVARALIEDNERPKRFLWTDEATEELVRLYNEDVASNLSVKGRWERITHKLNALGYDFTPEQSKERLHNMKKKKPKKWDTEATNLLTSLYKAGSKSEFRSRGGWAGVAEKLRKAGYNFTSEECRSMKDRLKKKSKV